MSSSCTHTLTLALAPPLLHQQATAPVNGALHVLHALSKQHTAAASCTHSHPQGTAICTQQAQTHAQTATPLLARLPHRLLVGTQAASTQSLDLTRAQSRDVHAATRHQRSSPWRAATGLCQPPHASQNSDQARHRRWHQHSHACQPPKQATVLAEPA